MFLACSRQGYVCNPSLHQNYTVAEIVALLARTRAAALFAQPGYGADASAPPTSSPQPPNCRACAGSIRSERTAATASRRSPKRPILPICRRPRRTRTRSFIWPSPPARPGRRKASCIRRTRCSPTPARWSRTGATITRTILLSLSPLSHHIATVALAEALAAGMELVVNAPPAGKTPLDWILETGASYVMGVPTHAIDILGEMRRRGGIDREARRGQDVLHGRLADPARGRAGVSRPRRDPAERLRDEREQLAPVHLAERRPGNDRRDLRAGLPRL